MFRPDSIRYRSFMCERGSEEWARTCRTICKRSILYSRRDPVTLAPAVHATTGAPIRAACDLVGSQDIAESYV
jgi:hypothetical protein